MAIFGMTSAQANNDAGFRYSMLKMPVLIAFQSDLFFG